MSSKCRNCGKKLPEDRKGSDQYCPICMPIPNIGLRIPDPIKVESLVGWTYKGWLARFHHDKAPLIEMQFPAIYKEKQKGMVRVWITMEECND